MPLNVAEIIFPIVMWLIVGAWVMFAIIIVMHFLIPASVLEKFFKPPYFKEGECRLFTGFPYAPVRTIMFMTVFAFPGRGKKRKLTEAYLSAPPWYRTASKIILVSLLSIIIAIPTLSFGLYFYSEFFS
jgi:hypothetical protein